MSGSAPVQLGGGGPAPQEAGFEIARPNPRVSEGFLIPDLSDPSQLLPGDVPFQTFEGKASIARAKVDWLYRLPEDSTQSVIITNGLGAKQGAYSDLADFLASHGIAVADYKTVHHQDLLAGFHPKHLLDPSRLVYQAPWGVIRDIQGRDDIEGPTDAFGMVGHSLGGRTAVKNAHQHPDVISNVITIDSVGLENHNLPALALRLPSFFAKDFRSTLLGRELDIDQKARLVGNGLLYFAEHPVRGGGEIWSLSNARIGDEMAELEEHDTGTAIVVSPEDSLISAGKTREESSGKPDLFVELPKLPDKRLDHMGPIKYPAVYGRVIIQTLAYLDAIKSQQSMSTRQAA